MTSAGDSNFLMGDRKWSHRAGLEFSATASTDFRGPTRYANAGIRSLALPLYIVVGRVNYVNLCATPRT